MSSGDGVFPQAEAEGDLNTRLQVLEMTVAAIAARLPKTDLQEVASMLVFVAKGADAATQLENPPADTAVLEDAARHATRMLDRIAKSRASERATPMPFPENSEA